jgi:hypothetical protein
MKPVKLGDVILVQTGTSFNGSSVHPAIVNRVWGEPYMHPTAGATAQTVNCTALPDCSTTPVVVSSCAVFESEEACRMSGMSSSCGWLRPAAD